MTAPNPDSLTFDTAQLNFAIGEFLELAKQCLGNVDAERVLADADPNQLRAAYTRGLVDGMEEATKRLCEPFARLMENQGSPL